MSEITSLTSRDLIEMSRQVRLAEVEAAQMRRDLNRLTARIRSEKAPQRQEK